MRLAVALPVATLLSLSLTVGCAEAGERATSQQRLRDYLGAHRDTTGAVAEAIRLGHVVPGMDREQVTAALGEPIRVIRSSSQGGVEHWLYRMETLHQEQLRGRGWSFVRITFLDGRVLRMDLR
jgi:outer membrane protein assembly factor BamE (lipoprotein component of BamABCDE complex)